MSLEHMGPTLLRSAFGFRTNPNHHVFFVFCILSVHQVRAPMDKTQSYGYAQNVGAANLSYVPSSY